MTPTVLNERSESKFLSILRLCLQIFPNPLKPEIRHSIQNKLLRIGQPVWNNLKSKSTIFDEKE